MTQPAQSLLPSDLEPGEVEILRLGDHHGAAEDLTLEDFDAIVADYNAAATHQATAVIDHDPKDREPNDPHRRGINHGLIPALRRVKDSVVAKFDGVTAELRDLVNSGRLHAVTPEIYRQFRTTGRKYLRAVAFVGADTPAQKGLLRPVLMHEAELELDAIPLEAPALNFHEETLNMEKPTPNPTPSPTPAPAPPAPPVPPKAAAAPAEGGTLSLAEVTTIVTDAVAAAVAPLNAKIETMHTRLESTDPEYGDRAVVLFAEKLVADGKIEGKDKDRVVARAKALRGQVLKFGEGANATEVSALSDYMEQENARPAMAHFSELDVPGPNNGGRAREANGVLKFGEGKAPAFTIHVPNGSDKATVDRLRRLGEFAAEQGIKTMGEAQQRFEREAEGVHA